MEDPELEEVLRIARLASERVRSIYESPFKVEFKAAGDPVTQADRDANKLICEALAAAFPGDAVVAEESAPTTSAEVGSFTKRERVWFVDPLDGTREFTDRIGEFAVMVGLAVHARSALGVIVLPATGEAIAARVGRGTFAEAANRVRRPLHVSAVSNPSEARLLVSRSHRPPMIEPLIHRLGITRTVACGSVGVKIARIVFGEGDLYVHGRGAKRWDSCAPEALLVGAGGRVQRSQRGAHRLRERRARAQDRNRGHQRSAP